MITVSIVSTVVWLAVVPFLSSTVSYLHYNRVAVLAFILCLGLGIFGPAQGFDIIEQYHSLFTYSYFSMVIDSTLYLIAALVLVCFSPVNRTSERTNKSSYVKPEYSLILIFSILGASMIISANDIISMYVALELQSFGLYILACLRTDQTGSTHASLKYFLLGAISSAFILLGISIIYQEVGSTGFQNISSFLQVATTSLGDNRIIALGLLSILCGFMFKISAAPFHSWFSDVIQGVPTYTGMVIINLPKISIFTFLFNVLHFVVTSTSLASEVEMFLIITTLFSLVLGTVAGLMQTKLKRLLAFSTISHVGFILIGLTVGSESSLNAMVFYLFQYTLTVVLTFLALVAYENSWMKSSNHATHEVDYIVDLQGTGQYYKLLTFTFVLCLFSMAGIPPLTGFYAKLGVLNSSILQNISIVFITAIVCSVISAAYYLKVIKVLMFDHAPKTGAIDSIKPGMTNQSGTAIVSQRPGAMLISPLHSYTMATLTAFLCLFILDPKPMINCTELVALSLYITLLMTLFVVLIFVPILVLILLMLNLLLAPSEVDSEKISTYEAGFEPVGTARSQFSISFYLVAILFLIFDLEIALFYPLATSLNLVSTYGFVVGLIFLSVLTFGFVFEYGSGVISFKTERDLKQT